jgi:hypothetical protein
VATFIAVVAAGLIGLLVGASELLTRYRDSSSAALFNVAALLYLAINAAASIAAYGVAAVAHWKFGTNASGNELRALQVAVGGFGSIALFRSSLFLVHPSGQDVNVGPANILQSLLDATNREIDRSRGSERFPEVAKLMQGVRFDDAYKVLPTVVLASMQNLSEDEQAAFANQLTVLADSKLEDWAKSLTLGLTLETLVGRRVLRAAVDTLKLASAPLEPPYVQPKGRTKPPSQ